MQSAFHSANGVRTATNVDWAGSSACLAYFSWSKAHVMLAPEVQPGQINVFVLSATPAQARSLLRTLVLLHLNLAIFKREHLTTT